MSEALAAAVEGAQIRDALLLMLFAMILVVVIGLITRSLLRRDSDIHSRISLEDLLIDPVTKVMDPARCVLIGGFGIASLVLLYSAFKGTMTDTMYLIYFAGIVVPAVTVVLKTKVALPGGATTTTVTTPTETTTITEPKT